MERNKFGDFVVKSIVVKEEVVQVVDDLDCSSSEDTEEEVVKEETVEVKAGKYFKYSNSNCYSAPVKQVSKKEQKRLDDEEFERTMMFST
jgi:hypothetical protein